MVFEFLAYFDGFWLTVAVDWRQKPFTHRLFVNKNVQKKVLGTLFSSIDPLSPRLPRINNCVGKLQNRRELLGKGGEAKEKWKKKIEKKYLSTVILKNPENWEGFSKLQ